MSVCTVNGLPSRVCLWLCLYVCVAVWLPFALHTDTEIDRDRARDNHTHTGLLYTVDHSHTDSV